MGPPSRFKFWIGVTIAWVPFVVIPVMAFITAKNFDEQLGGGLFAVVTIVALIICLRMIREAWRYRLDYDETGVGGFGQTERSDPDHLSGLSNRTFTWDQIAAIESGRQLAAEQHRDGANPQITNDPNVIVKLRDGSVFVPLAFRDLNLVDSPEFKNLADFASRHHVRISSNSTATEK